MIVLEFIWSVFVGLFGWLIPVFGLPLLGVISFLTGKPISLPG